MSSPFPQGMFESAFRPAWWLRNPHAQTLFSTFFRAPLILAREREELLLPDGDFLDLDWHGPAGWSGATPLVLVVHGLSGSSDSHYVLGLQVALARQGWASVAMNCRGASGRPNNRPRAYHAGASDDILAVLQHMKSRYPQTPRALVGYSLGGSMTLTLMGQQQYEAPVFAAVAVSVPLQLQLCADRMDSGFSRVYRQHFMETLVAHWRDKAAHLEQLGDRASADKVLGQLARGPFQSFWQYDNELVAPLHGYQDVHDYYHRASPRQYLSSITCPTLVIQSADDPFMTPEVLPGIQELSSAVHFELCQRGGHVGFIEGGTPRVPAYYLERRIPDFLTHQWQAIQGRGELLG